MLSARGPHMRAFTQRIRTFSTQVQTEWPSVVFIGKGCTPRQNSLLGPNDSQYPFQGDVAFSQKANPLALRQQQQQQQGVQNKNIEAVLYDALHPVHTILARGEVQADGAYLAQMRMDANAEASALAADVEIELSAQKCPKILRKEMRYLFPQNDMSNMQISVMNLTQKSEHDMKAWSESMEEEREKLTAAFIQSATAICKTLSNAGYWADFIDPSSGRPFLEAFTNHTLFETNDAYRQMGFKIEDLGCCKVLQHACWGSHAFVGTIFTDAPADCALVKDILKKVNTDEVAME